MAKTGTDRIRELIARSAMIGMLGLLATVFSAGPALSENRIESANACAAVSDLIVVRPLAAALSTAATGVFVITLPLTYPVGQDSGTLHTLVEIPWNFAANRPLGIWKMRKPAAEMADRKWNERYSGILSRTSAEVPPEQIR